MRSLNIYLAVILIAFGTACRKEATHPYVSPGSFLSSEKYDRLIVEIQYVNGYEPSQVSVTELTDFLRERLNKLGGIAIVKTSVPSPGISSYAVENIIKIEKESRTQNTSGSTLTAYIFFADAGYAGNNGNSQVLGMAYGNTSIVIFERTIRDFSGAGINKPSTKALETTVMDHEFGHILGLVNNGSAMQTDHQDKPNGLHCSNKNCLMYYNVETTDVIANILGGNVPGLDANCMNDLKANGGK